MPVKWSFLYKATKRFSWFSSSKASSVTVPGVKTRVTARSTGPLEVAGSPRCSHIATETPFLINFAR